MNSNISYNWGRGLEADKIRTLDSKELSESIKQILKDINHGDGVWIFSYGSLMWNPDFKLVEKRTSTLIGFHRNLCLKSTVYRGSAEYYGLVFGLDKGDSCQGIAYRIKEEK